MKTDFAKKLLSWHLGANTREMPWKGEKDPYKIWISEIILQQTRVEQGLPYYNRFIAAFPTVDRLADAPEQAVFKLWEGLGYYSRCKNLIATAKIIAHEMGGKFPDNYEAIKALKGIGPYTAAAISSFAFNLPYAVVDGNVYRVLARYFGITTPVDSTAGKKIYKQLADGLLDKKKPGLYNQAIMDFGAIICKPQQPLCALCVQNKDCEAYKLQVVHQLPVKEKTTGKKSRWFYYFVIAWKNKTFIRKRTGKDIWQNLYEFGLVEAEHSLSGEEAGIRQLAEEFTGINVSITGISREYTQQLSHQTIKSRFITLVLRKPPRLMEGYEPVVMDELSRYPFPALINNFLLEGNLIEKI